MISTTLKDKVIVITGASRGIGLAIAKECDREEATVVLVATNKVRLDKARKTLSGVRPHLASVCDVSRADEVKALAKELKKKYIRIDGLVNCAGILGPIGLSGTVAADKFVRTLEVNLVGPLMMCQAMLPLMLKAGKGKIVNISGGGAAGPFPNYSAYAASKAGLVRLTENMAVEYKDKGIRVNSIAPGFVATDIHQGTLKAGEKAGEDYLKRTKEMLKRGSVSPRVAARLTAFLLSESSSGITGKFISAPWDPWEEQAFLSRLKEEPDAAVLRRIDDKYFAKNKKG